MGGEAPLCASGSGPPARGLQHPTNPAEYPGVHPGRSVERPRSPPMAPAGDAMSLRIPRSTSTSGGPNEIIQIPDRHVHGGTDAETRNPPPSANPFSYVVPAGTPPAALDIPGHTTHQNSPVNIPVPLPTLPQVRSRRTQPQKISKRTKATLQIASLNMNGKRSQNMAGPLNKWNAIHTLIRKQRIGIMALQETHLTLDDITQIEHLYGKTLQIFHSPHPTLPNRNGVAFVLNRERTVTGHAMQTTVLVPGRAILLEHPWHASLTLRILNVYAPNIPSENAEFWNSLNAAWDDLQLPNPDIICGDFNIVEDALDRLPCHVDPLHATAALRALCEHLRVYDGWRHENPDEKNFTFAQANGGSQSRIDRIYVSEALLKNSTQWNIDTTPVPTDHRLISFNAIDAKAPFLGTGRWTIPLFLLKDKELSLAFNDLGLKLENDISNSLTNRTPVNNPQTLFKTFKDQIIALCRTRARSAIPKIDMTIKKLKTQLKTSLNPPTDVPVDDILLNAGLVQERITQLETAKFLSSRTSSLAHYRIDGETINKYWSQINKSRSPRDYIPSLQVLASDPPVFVHRSDEMSNLARTYHSNLQNEQSHTSPIVRETEIRNSLDALTQRVPAAQHDRLALRLTTEDVRLALQSSHNGKATGINGIPYELWKLLQTRHTATQKPGKRAVDIIKVLTHVYNDIERYGVEKDTDFAAGWLCPLYKKKDKCDIANYRPITLLNSDYKIFTKALSMKLVKIAPSIIHENQAGFLPERSIFDQVKLSKLMIDYAEATEENGLIISLDQEKAYDKVAHDYLWRTLERVGLPQTFISTFPMAHYPRRPPRMPTFLPPV